MRAAEPEQTIDARFARRAQHGHVRARTDGDNLPNAGDARRDGGHQQRRRQGIAPAGDIAANAIQGSDPLFDPDARHRADRPAARDLPAGDPPDVPRRQPDRVPDLARRVAHPGVDLRRIDLDRQRQPIELARERQQRWIAVAAHPLDDPRDA